MKDLYSTFYCGDLFLGIRASSVRELIRPVPLTKVSGAGPDLLGIFNLRGEIITSFDAKALLGLPPSEVKSKARQIIFSRPEGIISLLVDKQGEVLELDDDLLVSPPANFPQETLKRVKGVFRLDHQLLFIINIDHLTD